MKLGIAGGVLLVLVLVAAFVGYSSIYTVPETRQAIVIRLGNPVRVVSEAGLHFKAPFIDSVVYVDKRILDLENPTQEVIASDQKRLVVDAFARYKIVDPLRFYQAIGRCRRPTRNCRRCSTRRSAACSANPRSRTWFATIATS